MSVITHDESAAVLPFTADSIDEYWEWILNDLIYPENDGNGQKPYLIVDDGGDMTLLILKNTG